MQPRHTTTSTLRPFFNRATSVIVIMFIASLMLLVTSTPTFAQSNQAPTTAGKASQTSSTSYTGEFYMVLGGDAPLYYLQTDKGQNIEFQADEAVMSAAGGIWNLNHHRIQLDGQLLGNSRRVANASVVTATAVQPVTASGNTTSAAPTPTAITGSRPFVNILCKFSDVSSEPQAPSYFTGLMSNTYPGMDNYFREASYNNINLNGTIVVGWYTLPHPRSYYVSSSLDFGKAAQDCTAAADSSVNFNSYQGINLMFNNELDGYAWGGSWSLTLDGTTKAWPMTWLPPWGYNNQTVLAHEMGHAFGMPHSGDSTGTTYKNVWDVMSDTWTNCNLLTVNPYGCIGQHEISYSKDIPGWIASNRQYIANGGTQNITLERLAQPSTSNYLMVKIPLASSSYKYYTIEARYRVSYDQKVPSNGVVIHSIDTTRTNPAWVVDADGGSTQNAAFTVGQSFTDAANGITVTVNSATSSGFNITVKSPWLVTKNTDDGAAGSLSYAASHAQSGDTIKVGPYSGSTLTVKQTVNVAAGVALVGSCGSNGATIILDGSTSAAGTNGVVLGKGASASGVKITHFKGNQLVTTTGNKLSCVSTVK